MERCNRIYNHPVYQNHMAHIAETERERKFCPHNLEHALDVARIGRIMILEQGIKIDTELFYAAALLHDAGRYNGLPHNEAGALLAEELLPQCGFSDDETKTVAAAIRAHRADDGDGEFSRVLYTADKKSRLCFKCPAAKDCYWDTDKRNMEIEV